MPLGWYGRNAYLLSGLYAAGKLATQFLTRSDIDRAVSFARTLSLPSSGVRSAPRPAGLHPGFRFIGRRRKFRRFKRRRFGRR